MGLLKQIRQTDQLLRRHYSPHGSGRAVLHVHDLTVRYDGQTALDHVSFELQVAERIAVVGPNGAGKSTLFKVIAGVLRPTEGQVEVFGHVPDSHACIAYVPQRKQVDWNFPVNVADVVMMGRTGRMGLFRQPRARDWQTVHEALAVVGLQDLAGRQINQLSGGQQQRMFIARALAQEAELMLMDEPLTGLDAPAQEDIFHILDTLRTRQVTVLMALHDLQIAATRFDRVMLLNHRLIGLGRADEVFAAPTLMDAYGSHLRLLTVNGETVAVEDTCCDEGTAAP